MGWGIALLGVWLLQKTYYPINGNDDFIGPMPPEPPLNGNGFNLKMNQWDDAVVGLVILGIVLFSKPWK
jgi:hypothetical protein